MYKRTNPIFLTVIVGLLCGLIGWQVGHYQVTVGWQNYHPQIKVINQTPPANLQTIDFSLFWQTWNLVSQKYVDKKAIDPQKMYYGAIQGMVAAVGDPYTIFLPPESQKPPKKTLVAHLRGWGLS